MVASAAPTDVPLISLGPAPQNGTLLSNGVNWSVALNPGPAVLSDGWNNTLEYYRWAPSEGIQAWTFSTPVNLSFTVNNLQNVLEGVTLPAGTKCTPSADAISWGIVFDDSGPLPTLIHTETVVNANLGNYPIPCTLNNTTSLTMDTTSGAYPTNLRGLQSLTAAPATLSAQFSGLPSLIKPGETAHGTLTCSNIGSGQTPPQTGPDALNVTCDPVIASGGGSISNVQCTPPTPVGTLHDGQSIVCTFDLTAPNTSTVNMQLTGTTTADGLFATTATRSPGGMTATLWLSSAAAAVPTLNEWALIVLALGLAGVVGLHRKRRV